MLKLLHVCTAVDSLPSPSNGGRDRRSILPLARNALRKLRSLRHPDVLRFIDGHETDTAIYIITEAVTPLTARIGTEGQQPGQGEEWKVWGLSRIVVSEPQSSVADAGVTAE
jgi:SCY1-like protein 1